MNCRHVPGLRNSHDLECKCINILVARKLLQPRISLELLQPILRVIGGTVERSHDVVQSCSFKGHLLQFCFHHVHRCYQPVSGHVLWRRLACLGQRHAALLLPSNIFGWSIRLVFVNTTMRWVFYCAGLLGIARGSGNAYLISISYYWISSIQVMQPHFQNPGFCTNCCTAPISQPKGGWGIIINRTDYG